MCVCDLLGIQVEVRAVDLVEPPKEVFGSTIDIVTSRVVRKIVTQR